MTRPFREEFAQHWNVMLASIIGIGCGAIALPTAAISLFMRSIQADFGWSRTDLSFTSTIVLATLALAAPVIGFLADRYRTSAITGFSMFAMAGCFLLLSHAGKNLGVYLALFAMTALLAAGVTTVPFARAISIAFRDNRGKALGLAMLGNGLSGVALPQLLVPLVAENGWRAGFRALAVIAVIAAPILAVLLRIGEPKPRRATRAQAPAEGLTDAEVGAIGMTPREAMRSRPFQVLAVVFPLIAIASAGLQLHFVAILGDNGLSTQWVAWYASAIGIVLTITRVVTGYLLDAFPAQRVSAAIMGLGAVSTLVFAFSGTWGSVFGAIAIGMTVGAEIDMVGYFASRYFGFASYGRVYGMLYGTILISTAVSPLIYGQVKDKLGDYTPALVGSAALLVLSTVFLLLLARLPYPNAQAPTEPAARDAAVA